MHVSLLNVVVTGLDVISTILHSVVYVESILKFIMSCFIHFSTECLSYKYEYVHFSYQ